VKYRYRKKNFTSGHFELYLFKVSGVTYCTPLAIQIRVKVSMKATQQQLHTVPLATLGHIVLAENGHQLHDLKLQKAYIFSTGKFIIP
jgi:hypothetical protein